MTFYGGSFITGCTGELLAQAPENSEEAVIVAEIDLMEAQLQRSSWGIFRDRRTDLYDPILTLDGRTRRPF